MSGIGGLSPTLPPQGRRQELLLARRQVDDELGAGARRALAAHLPAMADHHRADEGQAQARTGITAGLRTGEPLERFEDAFHLLRRQAGALVGYRDPHAAVLAGQADDDLRARRAVLHRVLEQVGEGPGQQGAIPEDEAERMVEEGREA